MTSSRLRLRPLRAAGFSAAIIALAMTVAAQNFPFPQHTTYTAGTIKPNNVTQSAMDSSVISKWNTWKSNYLKPAGTGKMYVKFDSSGATVSEAHGYGMLLTVLMAGADASAKTEYDSLYNYYKAHPSVNNSFLMAWKQNSSFQDVEGADSATDGDMDIAYSLLLADKQWGSTGTINYLQAATNMINALMASDVNHTLWNLKLGDWATGADAPNTRPSDFMLEHLKAYKAATGDSRWDNVIATTYNVINTLFANYSPNTGLIPDFVVPNGSSWKPAAANFLEGPHDGEYDYNSCRTPWRFPVDYLFTGDTRALTEMQKMNSWIKGKVSSNPSSILDGYHLNGGTYGTGNNGCFFAPFGVCAMIDSANQTWLNNVWSKCASTGAESYYDDSVRQLSMIVISGNYWMPSSTTPPPDFTVSATPSSQTVTAGSNTTYTVNVGNLNAFSGSVALTVSNLPTGASANFAPTSVNPPGSSTLTITTTSSTATGTKTLTITGTSGSLTHSTTVSLTVNAASGVTLLEAESLATTTNGATATLNSDAGASGGAWMLFNSTATGQFIEFTTPSLAAGTYDLAFLYKKNTTRAINSVTVDGGASLGSVDQWASAVAFAETDLGNVTFATAGTHKIRLTVTGKNASSTGFTVSADAFRLTFVSAPNPDFSIAASPASRTVTVGNSTTYTVTIGAINGFTGTVDLTASGLPAGATAGFNPASVAGAGTSTVTITTSGSTPVTTSTLTFTGTSGALNHGTNVTLITQAAPVPDFAITATPASQTVTAGNSTTYTVTITATNGFAGNVDLTASGLPTGATASFNPASINSSGTSTLTVTTASNTPAGTSTLTLTGTSGSLTHNTAVSLIVNTSSGALTFEAENLAFTTNGAVAGALQIDTNASNGQWVLFNSDSAGDWIQFTLPNVPAGTYSLKMDFKKNNNRAILQLSVDGANVGSTVDQYASPSVYTSAVFGNVTFSTTGNHTVRLTVSSKNASSSGFTMAADKFTLTPTNPPPPTVTMEAESLPLTLSGATSQITADANASGGNWLQINSDGVGDSADLTTTSLPAGTYQVQFKYKTNTTRGQHTISIDGNPIGGTIDQYAATPTYPTITLGTVTFSSAGTHTLHLQVTGKNAAASNFLMSADAFTFVGQ